MKRTLALRRETLADLTGGELGSVAGGITYPNCWGPTTLIPNHVIPPPPPTWQCGGSGMC